MPSGANVYNAKDTAQMILNAMVLSRDMKTMMQSGNMLGLPIIPSGAATGNDMSRMMEMQMAHIAATNQRIDRLQVFNNVLDADQKLQAHNTIKQAQQF
jgi:hypothetical protein